MADNPRRHFASLQGFVDYRFWPCLGVLGVGEVVPRVRSERSSLPVWGVAHQKKIKKSFTGENTPKLRIGVTKVPLRF